MDICRYGLTGPWHLQKILDMMAESEKKDVRPQEQFPWHSLGVEEVCQKLEVDKKGLGSKEFERRLEVYGPNRLPEAEGKPAWQRFLVHFHNILIYVLIGAGVVTALLGHWIDTGVIFAVVVINALIGFIQEGKAEKALDAIRKLLSLEAVVLRDGREKEIEADQLVPGDVVVVKSGDKLPADIRFFQTKSLRIEEAALTGESLAVDKEVDPVDEDAPLGDRNCMGFSSTMVVSGQGRGVVVATGASTEIGKINAMIAEAPTLTTPLLRQMDQFGRRLTYVILAAAALVFLIGVGFRETPWGEVFLAVVGLAVAAIPEGLPAILTITLALGVQKMAARNAIIRRLPAVETLGAVSVICSDKTGTLTRNEMMVATVVTPSTSYAVTGSGYNPSGEVTHDLDRVDPTDDDALDLLSKAALLCNDSRLEEEDGRWRVSGDPTEGALVALARKYGLDEETEKETLPRVDSIPFESSHKFMTTLHEANGGEWIAFLKGAPEKVLERCQTQLGKDGEEDLDPDFWSDRMHRVATKGERLLAVAYRRYREKPSGFGFEEVRDGFVFLGVCGLLDPPRDEAISAVEDCQKAGIRVKMITGDHAETARAIGRQMGLSAEEVVTGNDLDQMADEELPEVVDRVDIFARTTPEHKLRLVTAIQKRGRIVAMTGDGVNDAPALKSADIGVAMGIKGTEAAKEASEMVLADDNFASIANAVEEGRTVYDNLRKSILFILPTNGGQALVIILAITFGFDLPITPVQILWVNMITAVTLALALAFEPPEERVMRRPPRDPDAPIFSMFFFWRTSFVSILLTAGALGTFWWKGHYLGLDLEAARTIAVNTLIFGQIFYLLNSRFLRESSLRKFVLTENPIVLYAISLIIVGQMIFTYLPPFQFAFGTEALGLRAWFPVVTIGVAIFLLVELEKGFFRRHRRSAEGR